MKRILTITIIVFLVIGVVPLSVAGISEFQSTTGITNISTTSLGSKVKISLDPNCSKGEYPEWKNVTVYNIDAGRIIKVDITHPEGFQVSKVVTPNGWKVNYNILDRLITIEADPSAGIGEGKHETFSILFSEGPSEEGRYTFWVTVSNPTIGYSETQKLDEFIDKTPPEVTIINPKDRQVIKGSFYVYVSAHDKGLYPCGIDRVELYIDGKFYDYMNYDPEKQLYYLRISSLDVSEKWYTMKAKAYDKAYPGGNSAWSNTVKFFWFAETIIKVYNKLIYDVFGKKVAYGHVCSSVVVEGTTGFTPNSIVKIYFDNQKLKEVPTDEYGRFNTIIHVPECPRGKHVIRATDGNYSAEADFKVYPWMFGPNGEGYVGDTFTVEGKGFAANVEVFVYYRDVAKCRVHWDEWATEWWNETDYMKWNPVLDSVIVAKVKTNNKGSFKATFTIPESYGGLHPIYGKEKGSGIRSGYPPDESLWRNGLDQCVTFHVKTNIWVTPNTGVAEQYITIYGSGLPVPQGYSLIINDKYVYKDRQWSIVLDFGPHKYWIWEHNYILNNEVDMGWLTGTRFPIYYRDSCSCCNEVWNGTLCWADIDSNTHKGSPFLKVPNLINGEYIIKLYFFDEEALQDVYNYGDQETFTIMKDPLVIKVETGNLHFPDEIVTVIIKTNVDGRTEDVSQMTVKLFHESEFISTLDWSRIDVGLYYVSFKCPSESGTYFIIVSAAKQYESFTLYAEGTAGFTVSPTLNGLNAQIKEIKNGIVSINSTVGNLSFELDDLEMQIIDIKGTLVDIKTHIGTLEANLTDIVEKIVAINGTTIQVDSKLGPLEINVNDIIKDIEVINGTINEVIIKTYLEDISGKIDSIDGEIATISTEIGTLKTNVGNIKGLTEDISGYGGMQKISVAFSMIAAFAAIIVVVIVLRRAYKK